MSNLWNVKTWRYLVIKSITDKGIYGINEKKETVFIENNKLEPSLLEEIKKKVLKYFDECNIVVIRKRRKE